MSVTAVLVPIDESEARALLAGSGQRHEILKSMLERAQKLRARVALLDSLREDLHTLLFPLYERSTGKRPSFLERLQRMTQLVSRHSPSQGYDPFVQLFGRSFPVAGDQAEVVAASLARLLELDEDSFWPELSRELQHYSEPAAKLVAALHSEPKEDAVPQAPQGAHKRRKADAALQSGEGSAEFKASAESTTSAESKPSELHQAKLGEALQQAFSQEEEHLGDALVPWSPDLERALKALLRLFSWSRPVWRLDGDLLGELLGTVHATFRPASAAELLLRTSPPPPSPTPDLEAEIGEAGLGLPGQKVASPEVATHGAVNPDAVNPDAVNPDAVNPEAVNPDAANPDAATPDAANPDAVNPDAANPDAVNPDAVNPDAVNPDAANPEAVNPDAVNPDAANPDAVNPDAVNPDAVNPDAVNPDAVNPDAVNPHHATSEAKPDDTVSALLEELHKQAQLLPKSLKGFDSVGGYLNPEVVKALARTFPLLVQRHASEAARSSESPLILMRHLRLLEEALVFCASQNLGLCEASGIEWHDLHSHHSE